MKIKEIVGEMERRMNMVEKQIDRLRELQVELEDTLNSLLEHVRRQYGNQKDA